MILTIRKYYHITWAVNNGSVLNLLLNLNKEIIDGGNGMRGEYWSQSIELSGLISVNFGRFMFGQQPFIHPCNAGGAMLLFSFTFPFTSWSLAIEKRSQQKTVHIPRKATVRCKNIKSIRDCFKSLQKKESGF